MNKPMIAVDMDDTICNLIKRAIYHHNNSYPSHVLRYEQFTSWDTDHIRHPDSTLKEFFGKPGLFEELELFDEHVVNEVYKLHEAYDLVILTASYPTAVIEKWNWLQKHMPFIPYDNFLPCKRKDLIPFDLLIDDGPHNLIPAMQKGKNVICIPQPWNASFRGEYKPPIMESWQGAKERIDAMLGDSSWKV